jgi:hypothetical protein
MPQGTEYLTSNRLIAYPFREDAEDLLPRTAPTIPLGLFVDAAVTCHSSVTTAYLTAIVWNGTSMTLQLEDQDNNVLFTGTSAWPLPQNQPNVELVLSPTPGPAPMSATLRVVVHAETMTAFLASPFGLGLRLPFEATVVVPRPLKVETLELYTADVDLPAPPEPTVPGSINGDVQLLSGYNIDQFVESTVINDNTGIVAPDMRAITLGAIPGAGQGAYPCDDPDRVFAEDTPPPPMSLSPDERGNVNVEAGDEGCYSIVPFPSLGRIQVQGVCEACCSCEDYERVAKALQSLLERSKDILDVLDDARDNYYEPGVTHFNDTVSPIYHDVTLQLRGSTGGPPGDDDIRSHSVNWAAIFVSMKNNRPYAVQPISCTLTITTPSATIRTQSWEADGIGGELKNDQNMPLDGVPQIGTGDSLHLHFRAYTDYDTAIAARECLPGPTWAVHVRMVCYAIDTDEVHIRNPDGSPVVIIREDEVEF